jgi:acyl carrier protein
MDLGDADLGTALRTSISKVCGIPIDSITPTSTLADLGVDSLASAEVITDLEIRLGKDLPLDALRRLSEARTVGDVEAAIAQTFASATSDPDAQL